MKVTFNCDPRYYKNKDLLILLQNVDFSDMEKPPVISENDDGSFNIEFSDGELLVVKMAINDEILMKGLENQNKVNETGKMLYWLYDEIMIQTNN